MKKCSESRLQAAGRECNLFGSLRKLPPEGGTQNTFSEEIPPDVIAAVVIADLARIEAGAATHQDPEAQNRILNAVGRLGEIAQTETPPTLLICLPEIRAVLSQSEDV